MNVQAFNASTDLKKWVEDRFVPVVVVSASRSAEQIARKNGISFTDLLRPFDKLQKDVHTRTIKEDGAYALKGFSIRLRHYEELRNAKEDTRQKYFFSTMKQCTSVDAPLEQTLSQIAASPSPSYPSVDLEGLRTSGVPWLEQFRQDYAHSCRFNYWDTFDHPLGMILAVSTREEKFLERFRLLEAEIMNPLFSVYTVDPGVYRTYILLHDAEDGPAPAVVASMLAQMKEEFGAMNSKLLVLNSSRQVVQASKVTWKCLRPAVDVFCCNDSENVPMDHGPIGLTSEEADNVRNIVQDFIELGLLPHMDRKLRAMYAVVNTRSRGKLNKMLSWFGAGKVDTPQQDTSDKFPVDSYEMQVRKVADLLFLLRDYVQALNFYKQLKTELTSTTTPPPMSLPYLASCHEAIGLCLWLQGRSNAAAAPLPAQTLSAVGTFVSGRKDSESSFDQALGLYLKCQRYDYAYRVSFFTFALSKARQNSMRCAEVMLRAATIDDRRGLYSALFLEQSALCHLTSTTGCYFRKFAFYMVLAALKYGQSGLSTQAIRCNRLAAIFYPGKTWGQVQDHLNSTLGRLYEEQAVVSRSADHMFKAIVYTKQFMQLCSQPEVKQETILQQFCQQWMFYLDQTNQSLINNFNIPLVDTSVGKVRILTNMYGFRGNASPNLAARDADILDADDLDHPAWRALQLMALERRPLHPSCNPQAASSVVGELVEVTLPITNPLNVPLFISNLSLGLEYKPPESNDGAELPNTEPYTTFPIQRLQLAQNETRIVKLAFTPKLPGTIRLLTVAWTLCGLVRGSRDFGIPSPTVTNSEGFTTTEVIPTSNLPELKVTVTPPMPALASSFVPVPPSQLLHGEIHRASLALHNSGKVPMTAVRLAFTDPSFLTFAECSGHAQALDDLDPSRLLLLPGVTIAPGEDYLVTAFIRGAFEGDHGIRLVMAYSDPSEKVFRVHYCRLQLQVRPCLRLRAFCLNGCPVLRTPVDQSPYLMVLEVHNCRREGRWNSSAVLNILQLTTVSRHWQAVPLNFQLLPTQQPLQLPSNHSFVVFFKLRRTPEDKVQDQLEGAPEYAVQLNHLAVAQAQDQGLQVTLNALYDSSGQPSVLTSNGIDTSKWPMAHFLFNTLPGTSPLPPISLPASPISLPTPGGLFSGDTDPVLPLTFSCHWASSSQDHHIGTTQLTTLPYEWNKGWMLTSLDLSKTLAQLLQPPVPGLGSPFSAGGSPKGRTAPAPRVMAITYALQYPSYIPFSFGAVTDPMSPPATLCEAEFTLTITNGTNETQALTVTLHQTAPGYRWLGKPKNLIPSLQSGTSMTMRLRVGFSMCGVHDLNNFSVVYSKTKMPATGPHGHYFCRVGEGSNRF